MIIIRCFPKSKNAPAKLASDSKWKTIKIAVNSDAAYYTAEQSLDSLWRRRDPKGGWPLKDELKFSDIAGAQEFIDSIQSQDWYRRTFPFEPDYRLKKLGITDHPRIKVEAWSSSHPLANPSDQDFIAVTKSERKHTNNPEYTNPTILLSQPLEESNQKLILLHELAHVTHLHRVPWTDEDEETKGHGPSFRGTFLHILHHALGSESAEALRDGYHAENLNFDSNAVDRYETIPELLHPDETDR